MNKLIIHQIGDRTCSPCMIAMLALEKLQDKFPDTFEYKYISLDIDKTIVHDFNKKYNKILKEEIYPLNKETNRYIPQFFTKKSSSNDTDNNYININASYSNIIMYCLDILENDDMSLLEELLNKKVN